MVFRAAVLLFLCASSLARAADIKIAPVEAWVTPVGVPAASVRDAHASLQTLLLNRQMRVRNDGIDQFEETALHIQSAQGLTDAGTVEVVWDPATETAVLNRLTLLRDGKTIDLLKDGSEFSVLRRETNLERAMLDGQLTAARTLDGLQVGDVIDFAYTLHRNDPALHGHGELILRDVLPMEPDHLFVRALYPPGKNPRWQAGEFFARPKVSAGAAGTEIVEEMRDVQAPRLPEGAPLRFEALQQMEVSDFATWADAGAVFAPAYEAAAQLAPDSPLRAEIARIRSGSADPVTQAEAALHLVQEKVRYLFLGMGDGGYVPAPADLTWSRRFGDCKGKTVLLVALLRGLGIEASPVLVSTEEGNGLDGRLPTLGRFDHAIVRAQIGGHVYWLDGTRLGDTTLAALDIPDDDWALPVRAPGSPLERLDKVAAKAPVTETTLRLDGSAGFFQPAAAHGEHVLHGDAALRFSDWAGSVSNGTIDAHMRDYWHGLDDAISADKVAWQFDPQTATARLTMDGHFRQGWQFEEQDDDAWLRLETTRIAERQDFSRAPGPHDDAPFVLDFPSFTTFSLDYVLPAGGQHIRFYGKDISRRTEFGAWERNGLKKAGVLHVTWSRQVLAPEVPHDQAPALAALLKKLSEDTIVVETDGREGWTAQDLKSFMPSEAPEYMARARRRLSVEDFAGAMADADAAVSLSPGWGRGYAYRALVHLRLGEPEQAGPDLARAVELAPRDVLTLEAQGDERFVHGDLAGAIAAYSDVLGIDPKNRPARLRRAHLYSAAQDRTHALQDCTAAILDDPQDLGSWIVRWDILADNDQNDTIAVETEAFADSHPKNALIHHYRGTWLSASGKTEAAIKEFAAALALQPSGATYLQLARMARQEDDLKTAMDALDKGLALEPAYMPALAYKGFLLASKGETASAAATVKEALAREPADADVLATSVSVFAMLRMTDQQIASLDRLVAIQPGRFWLNNRCWAKVTAGRDPNDALADCNAALGVRKDYAEALDSRGLVFLKMNRLQDAVSDYTAALKLRPALPSSLYGRAVALMRAGSREAALQDLAAARKIDPKIDDEFAAYGVKI